MSSRSQKTDARRRLPETVMVARVRRPHGLRGEVVVDVLTDRPERLEPGSRLLAVLAGGDSLQVAVGSCRRHGSGVLLGLEGVEDRSAAEELRGALLEVEVSRLPEAPRGSYYFHELVGCRCKDRREGELGAVEDVIEDGGGLLLVVADDQRRLMVPFVQAYIERIDVGQGEIDLILPEGLLEACTSRS